MTAKLCIVVPCHIETSPLICRTNFYFFAAFQSSNSLLQVASKGESEKQLLGYLL